MKVQYRPPTSEHSNNLITSKLALLQVFIILASQCKEKLLCTGTFYFLNCVTRIATFFTGFEIFFYWSKRKAERFNLSEP